MFRDIKTTTFDPASVFLNFLHLVHLLYCYFTKVDYENPDCSFYLPVSMSWNTSVCEREHIQAAQRYPGVHSKRSGTFNLYQADDDQETQDEQDTGY